MMLYLFINSKIQISSGTSIGFNVVRLLTLLLMLIFAKLTNRVASIILAILGFVVPITEAIVVSVILKEPGNWHDGIIFIIMGILYSIKAHKLK